MGRLFSTSAVIGAKSAVRVSKPSTSRFRASSSRRGAEKVSRCRTLLWIDDYEPGLAVYKALFEGFGFKVLTASRVRAGLALAITHNVDAAVVDYEMPEMTGDVVAAALRATHPGLPIILFSAHADVPERARRLFDACCEKTMSRETILATIESVLARRSANPLLREAHAAHGHGYHR